jgi:hypothetical protein
MALGIPVEPCEPPAGLCSHEPEVELSPGYLDRASIIAGHQVAKAGFGLASLLNEIWPQPVCGELLIFDTNQQFAHTPSIASRSPLRGKRHRTQWLTYNLFMRKAPRTLNIHSIATPTGAVMTSAIPIASTRLQNSAPYDASRSRSK